MRFVIDTNVLIEAYRRYYAFDLAPKFWGEIVNHVGADNIVCVDQSLLAIREVLASGV